MASTIELESPSICELIAALEMLTKRDGVSYLSKAPKIGKTDG